MPENRYHITSPYRIPPRNPTRKVTVLRPMIKYEPDVEYSVEVEITIPPDFMEQAEPPVIIDLIENMISQGTGIDKQYITVRKFVNKTPVSRGDITGIA